MPLGGFVKTASAMLNHEEIQQLNEKLKACQPREILEQIVGLIPNIAISFSGAEDIILVDLASKLTTPPPIFTLDTGRLHPETHRFIERIREYYKIPVEVLYPDAKSLETFTRNKGLFSFYEDGHRECCGIRKVEPLEKKLKTLEAWVTGQRRDQNSTRSNLSIIELDSTFSTESHSVIKVNPLTNWTSSDVWNYIRSFEIPYNELHDRGYISIGCEPCTRAIRPNQHEREGRWWWEEATVKECGLHMANVKKQN